MDLSHRFSFCLVVLTVALTAGLGCSTTPDAPEEDQQPIEKTGAEDLVQTQDVLVAASVTPEELSTLTPLFQRLAQSVDEPEVRDLADVSPDPIGHLESMHDLPNELPALAENTPSYVMVTDRGNTEFLQVAGLGLPTQRDEWPAYFNVRTLLATDDTDALRDQLGPWLDHFGDQGAFEAVEVYEGPGFVRLEFAVENAGHSAPDGVDADQWLAGLNLENLRPPATADFRPTPAFETFTDGDAPFGMWSPADAYARLGTFELLEIFAHGHDRIGDAGQPRHFLEGVSRIAAASVADDPVSAEHEDLSVLLSSDADGALIIDTYTTRTERGAAIRQALEGSVDLPEFAVSERFMDLSVQADLQQLKQRAELPHWSTFQDWGEPDEIGADFEPGAEGADDSPIPYAEDDSGFVLLHMAIQYPWTSFATVSDTLADIVPLPRAMALEAFVPDRRLGGLPLGAGVAAAFDDSPDTQMAIEQLLGFGEGALPGEFDAELVERDDDLLEVRMSIGSELDAVFDTATDQQRIDETRFSLDLGPVQQLAGMVPGTDAFELFDHLHLRSHGDRTYQTNRLTIGADRALDPEPVDSNVEPMANPSSRCRTEIAALSIEHLSNLRGDSNAKIEQWADAVQNRAGECLSGDDPVALLIEERIELAREIGARIP